MKLYSYIVARDYGFAPNPFFGACTLATCKPIIRRCASTGDWIVGTGSRTQGLEDRIIYAMKVSEALSYDRYWRDLRFRKKRPILTGGMKHALGDNIYHRNSEASPWIQSNSHHSHADGSPNIRNIKNDTQTPRVLIGTEFFYWGASGPKIPKRFRQTPQNDVCIGRRNHKCDFSPEFISSFVEWLQSHGVAGYAGEPVEFRKMLNLKRAAV